MSTDVDSLIRAVDSLSKKVDELSEGNDLESEFVTEEPKKHSQMLDLDPERVDSFGDSIELITKSRLKDYNESFHIAKNFVGREYHNMIGNRYGKHSKLIPVFDEDGKENKIDMVWFSGNDVKIIELNGRQYYKIRLLVYDILTKKILLARIPTADGKARGEEIEHVGATRAGDKWKEISNMAPMKPISYSPKGNKTTMKQVGEVVFE